MGGKLPKGVEKHTVYTKSFQTKAGVKTFTLSAKGAGVKKTKPSAKPSAGKGKAKK